MREPWLHHQCHERAGTLTLQMDLALTTNWTAVFGPSGTGKSTWLRMLAGLLPQRSGSLRLHGAEVRHLPAHQRGIALVEQSPALFPHRNVEQNIRFGCPAGAGGRELVESLLADLHLDAQRRADVRTLSGGERQRVAVARALCSAPRLLLLDEVFTGMEARLEADLVAVVQRYCREHRVPVISVTHDVSEVFATADEVLKMQSGSVLAQGSPADVLAAERSLLLGRLQPSAGPA